MILSKIISRCKGMQLKKRLEEERKVFISGNPLVHCGTQFLGNNKIDDRARITNSVIGRATYIGRDTYLDSAKIGAFCSISYNVRMVCGEHPVNGWLSTHPAFYSNQKQAGFSYVEENLFEEFRYADNEKKYQLIIGNDVCIGAYAILRGGITIGDGAVVAAGSVVTKDVEPYSIVGGNPAKLNKYRFDGEKISELSQLKWWEWDDSKIRDNIEMFSNCDTSR